MERERTWPHRTWPLPAATALACEAFLLKERAETLMARMVDRTATGKLRKTLVKSDRYSNALSASEWAGRYLALYVERSFATPLTDSRWLRMWHARIHHDRERLDHPEREQERFLSDTLHVLPTRYDPWWAVGVMHAHEE